ncbi:MAG: OmpA family protein [Saprospirales bacterium]|nr:OmpA family protein [Saprospirales bacterium]MBK8921593.1 OmpA family protein [Saprospirales bacterium]
MFNRRLVACAFLFASALFLPYAGAQSVFDSLYTSGRTEVFFASGKHAPDAGALPALDFVAARWAASPAGAKIRITAHTDAEGNPAYNLALSERRAKTVQLALADRGLPAGSMELVYVGETQPAVSNASEEGRQRNRRATLETITAVPMVPYAGQVRDQKTGAGIPATVHFSTRSRRDAVQTDTAGRYAVRLPQDSVVRFEAYAEGYFFESVMQRIYGTPEMLRRMKNQPAEIQLARAATGERAVIKNLFFVGNEAVLLESSRPELPKVLRFMQINPGIQIEIAGHINHPYWNKVPIPDLTLSERRARLVYDYLVENGIPAGRLSFKGYQNTEMLFPNTRDAGEMEQNRRVEIRVE